MSTSLNQNQLYINILRKHLFKN